MYIDLWKKSNPQFLEILFTKYYICRNDDFKKILNMADRIANANMNRLLSYIKGMQMEKHKALKHPYPSIKDRIEKYGYDPKQLHHIYRLYYFGIDICENGKSFRDALIMSDKDKKQRCLDIKTNGLQFGDVDLLAYICVNGLKEVVDEYKKNYQFVVDESCYRIVKKIIYNIIIDKIKSSMN